MKSMTGLPRGWYESWRAVHAFLDEEGRSPHVRSESAEEVSLAQWLVKNRAAREKGSLSDRQDALLRTIPDANIHIARWEERFAAVTTFLSEHGRTPNSRSEDRLERSLGQWLIDHRTRKYARRTPRQAELLRAIPSPTQVRDKDWTNKLDAAHALLRTLGQMPTRETASAEDKPTVAWFHKQKSLFALGELTPQRRDSFSGLMRAVTEADTGLDPAWMARANALSAFIQEHGHQPSYASANTETKSLGGWLAKQRGAIKKGTIAPARVQVLENILGENNLRGVRTWDEWIARLRRHIASGGDISGSGQLSPDADVRSLCDWVRRQRNSSLTEQQRDELDTVLDGRARTRDELWQMQADKLEAWFDEHSVGPRWVTSDLDERCLHSWLKKQKSALKAGSLSVDRARALEATGALAAPTVADARWNARLGQLRVFILKNSRRPSNAGDTLHERSLSYWADAQLRAARRGQVTPERVACLLDTPILGEKLRSALAG